MLVSNVITLCSDLSIGGRVLRVPVRLVPLAHLGQQVLLYVEQAAMAQGECKLRETSTSCGNDALNIHAPGFPKIMLLLKLVV